MEQGERLHDDFGKYVEHGVAIGWNNLPFARMGWADEGNPAFGANAQALAVPQGRFFMAGDQITWWTGWQEGALISAWEAIKGIDRHLNPTATRG
jgi:monoamine oxidase